MYILGISCHYHDSSATLIKDGKVVAAAQEERFTRKKHDASFPKESIKYLLKSQGITIEDIEHIGFYEKPVLKFERVLLQHLYSFPKSYKMFLSNMPSWFNEKLRILKIISKNLKYKGDVFFIDHHMAHAASSFLPSGFEKAAILTTDGVGEWTTTTYGVGNKNKINLKKQLVFPDSLGLLYSTITAYLGFSVNNSEYKVMGLAAYGNMDKKTNEYYQLLKEIIDIKEDGSYKFDLRYFKYHYSNKMPSRKLCKLLGGKVRKPNTELSKRHKDIAAAVQLITEEVIIKILKHVHKETKMNNLVLSGGVALNSVVNGKILKNTPFKNIWINPDAGDGGTSMGVAMYVYNVILNKKRNFEMDHAYLGPGYKDEVIKKFLDSKKINYYEFKDDEELLKITSELLHKSKVVGWFQGKMEWGPRALGNRSILSNPTNLKMKDILNLKVKHREKFRPFAPVVCKEDINDYFDCDKFLQKSTDYMLMVYPIKEKWHKKLPAVTHVDGSGRLQTLKKDQNPLYYNLIKKFGKLSKVPILINTSFNIQGEPIVCSPADAYRCLMSTEIDVLVMGRFLIKRKENK